MILFFNFNKELRTMPILVSFGPTVEEKTWRKLNMNDKEKNYKEPP